MLYAAAMLYTLLYSILLGDKYGKMGRCSGCDYNNITTHSSDEKLCEMCGKRQPMIVQVPRADTHGLTSVLEQGARTGPEAKDAGRGRIV